MKRVPVLSRLMAGTALVMIVLAVAGGCTTPRQSASTPSASGDPIADRLDSLVAISEGDYIHFQVGRCFGWCDASVSIYRQSPAQFYLYEAEGWKYNEFQRDNILYRLRQPISLSRAHDLIQAAEGGGIFLLEEDRTMVVTDHPHIWVRARIGTRAVSVDKAYTGGSRYVGGATLDSALGKVYRDIRGTLLEPLFATQ